MLVSWVATPEDGSNMFLRKVGIYLQVHKALKTRRTTQTSAPPLQPESLRFVCVFVLFVLFVLFVSGA
jgi:hypothetical protein